MSSIPQATLEAILAAAQTAAAGGVDVDAGPDANWAPVYQLIINALTTQTDVLQSDGTYQTILTPTDPSNKYQLELLGITELQ